MSTPEATPIRRVVSKSLVFTIGNVLAKGSGLVLALLYLDPARLAEADFARLGLVQAFAALVAPVVALGLAAGMLRYLSNGTADERRAAPFTAFVLVAALGAAVFLAAWPFGEEIWFLMTNSRSGDVPAALLGRLTVALAVLDGIATVPLMRVQAREKAGWYSTITAGRFALLIAATFAALVVLDAGLIGAVGALVIASALVVAVTAAALLLHEPWTFQRSLMRKLIAYGAPLVLAGLALPTLHVGDRFLINALVGPEPLALYEAANRLASVLNATLVQGFHLAFAVIGLKSLDAGHGGTLHRRMFRHLSVVGFGFALGLSLFAFDALHLLASPESDYPAATRYVYPLAVGLVGYVLYLIGANVLYAHRRTGLVAFGLVFAAACNIGLNLLLLPWMGVMGAAVATAFAYGLMAAGACLSAERIEPIRFPWLVPLGLLVGTTGLYLAGTLTQDWPLMTRLAARTGLMLLYPLLVLALGIYRWAEVKAGARTLLKHRSLQGTKAPEAPGG